VALSRRRQGIVQTREKRTKEEKEVKEEVTARDLKGDFGIASDAETVEIADKGQVLLQREILGRRTPFVALLRHDRLEGLVDTRGLALRVAVRILHGVRE
jgi:hypothetical protein